MNEIFVIPAIIATFFFIFFLLRIFVKLLFEEDEVKKQYDKQPIGKSQSSRSVGE